MENTVVGHNQSHPLPMRCPSGFGMSKEQARELLIKTHGHNIGQDDPVLMLVTLLNAYLGETDRLQDRHNAALTKILTEQTGKYVTEVKKTTEALSAQLTSTTVEAISSTFQKFIVAQKQHRRDLLWLTSIIGMSALVNVIALYWKP